MKTSSVTTEWPSRRTGFGKRSDKSENFTLCLLSLSTRVVHGSPAAAAEELAPIFNFVHPNPKEELVIGLN